MITNDLRAVGTLLSSNGVLAALPAKVGNCGVSRIAALEHRLQDGPNRRFDPTSATAIRLVDGGYVVSYEEENTASAWRRGDPAMICLAKLPVHCPPEDMLVLTP